MERKRRLALWFLSACLVAMLFSAGHEVSHKGLPVAFLFYTSAGTIVRLKGCVPAPGIYRFPNNARVLTAINMTDPLIAGKVANKDLLTTELRNGDVIEVVANDRKHVEITKGRMTTKERMLLGIPLDPDRMDLADWDSLPGIGPVLANAIMVDRHKYGAFGSIEALQRVPGIGDKKLKDLKKYF
jgi:competence protein ComEA